MHLVTYPSSRSATPTPREVTWDEFTELLRTPIQAACGPSCIGKDCPHKDTLCWSPVIMRGARAKGNVESVHALVLDIDDVGLDAIPVIEAALEPYRYIIHESHTSRAPGSPDMLRLRIIIPLTAPVPGAVWPEAWASVIAGLNLPGVDHKVKDASRLYFFPTRPRGAGYLFDVHDGAPLDLSVFAQHSALPDTPTPAHVESISVDTVRDLIARHGSACAHRDSIDEKVKGKLLGRIARGDALATSGERDNEINRACSIIAFAIPPGCPTDVMVEIFRPSVTQMDCTPEGPQHYLDKVRSCWDRAVERRAVADAEASAHEAAWEAVLPLEPAVVDDDWRMSLKMKSDGESPENSLYNARVVIERSGLAGVWRWNDMRMRPEAADGPFVGAHRDDIGFHVATWLDAEYRIKISPQLATMAVAAVARKTPFNPVADYLGTIKWDGAPRIDRWLQTYCQAEGDDTYLTGVGSRFMIAAVARAMRPGCKVDSVLIFESPEGYRKTTTFEILGGEFFRTMTDRPGDRDAYMVLAGAWIVELGELDSFRKSQSTAIKGFLSAASDAFRAPYGAEVLDHPRHCVIVGTTNDKHYLDVDFGLRRFWPVTVGRIDTDALRRDRDQLFAEALARYNDGEPWWFDESDPLFAHLREQVENRQDDVPHAQAIAEWIARQTTTGWTSFDIARGALALDAARVDRRVQIQIGHAMKALGYVRTRLKTGSHRDVYVYKKKEDGL